MVDLPASAQRVVAAAAEHGLTLEVVEYPDGTRTANDAAAAVGCDALMTPSHHADMLIR